MGFSLFGKSGNTSSSTTNLQETINNDNRVGAEGGGIALGTGAALDQSFLDRSSTEINVIDSRDLSTVFQDSSQTTLNTTDARDLSTLVNDSRDLSTVFQDSSQTTVNTTDARDLSDRRVFNDNSTNYTLDAELAKTALRSGEGAFVSAGNVLEKSLGVQKDIFGNAIELVRKSNSDSLAASTRTAEISAQLIDGTTSNLVGFAKKNSADAFDFSRENLSSSLEFSKENAENSFGFSAESLRRSIDYAKDIGKSSFELAAKTLSDSFTDTDKTRRQQTDFISGFYRDRENNDSKVTGDLIKYAGAAAIVGLLAWGLTKTKS